VDDSLSGILIFRKPAAGPKYLVTLYPARL
jgi:hypothetical protein